MTALRYPQLIKMNTKPIKGQEIKQLTVNMLNILQVIIGRADPFQNGSCEKNDEVKDGNIFGGLNISYSGMVRYQKSRDFISKEKEMVVLFYEDKNASI